MSHSPQLSQETASSRRNFLSRAYLMGDVDPDQSTGPLVAYCFMTGFVPVVGFSAAFIWFGFQTGNTVQLALALARLFQGPAGQHDTHFHLADQQALTSITTFLGGAFLGRIGDKMGAKSRAWLFLGTMLQALFTMAAAVTIWQSGEGDFAEDRGTPAWRNALGFACIGFISASFGLQGIMGKRVNSQFATTIVLTTVWCELMADPKLFHFKYVRSRDHKILGVFALFVGGFVARAILQEIGAAGTLGVGCGMRVLVAFSWLFVPSKASRPSEKTSAA